MQKKEVVVVNRAEDMLLNSSRRRFLQVMGMGGAIVLMPSVLTSCSDNDDDNGDGGILGPNTGRAVTIDFAKGDTAVFQFAYALEQLEADFYTKVVANFSGSDIPAAEQTILVDIKNHEVIHREAFKAILGTANDFTLTPTYGALNFKSRAQVLGAARDFEDLGVSAYNRAAQYITDVNNLGLAGKIVSVEARHASTIRDLLAPKTNAFSQTPFDDAFRPSKVAAAAQGFIVEMLALANAPTAFVQGPNGNG